MYRGRSVRAQPLDEGFVELCFDREGEAINKFDARTVAELKAAVAAIAAMPGLRGVLATSAKDVFIVGADISEFGEKFALSHADLVADVRASNEAFVALEDLGVPVVAAIDGYALGGGFEFALACALRVMSRKAQVGLPEVKLGLFPGFGGTVRLARVAGCETAVNWVADGRSRDAGAALEAGAVDRICDSAALRETALGLLRQAAGGALDWRARQERKRRAVAGDSSERTRTFAALRERVRAASPVNQPAAMEALDMMERAAALEREGALALESEVFAHVARTQAASSLVQAFLDDQQIRKRARSHARGARPVRQAMVLGAGIMGSGIALTSARSGIPVRVKDTSRRALEAAAADAARQLARQVKTGRLSAEQADAVRARIVTQTDDDGAERCDLVVEAIAERLEIKHAALGALEEQLAPDAVLASNTSSLRIDDIARPLRRPERLVGMHFFNPVPSMQLVEVVKGSRSSDEAVATAVAYAAALQKTPIVVRDGPGFLVNRLLMAYTGAALRLIAGGADYLAVDRAMEAFGWPMGPSWLQDVIGIDTGSHVADVIAAGHPARMPPIEGDPLKLMLARGRLGQKTGLGFYRYERGADGRMARHVAPDTAALLAAVQPRGPLALTDEAIVERLMLPFVVEAAHALDEGVVETAGELDAAVRLALGCPAWIGGPLKYADWLGLDAAVRRLDALAAHGPMYQPTPRMRRMAAEGGRFHTPGAH
ncbi:MAG: 3-hydroxyacyl-CoA dehydrogenase NAD-binding domain-containing protein [Rubrivivax sp.]